MGSGVNYLPAFHLDRKSVVGEPLGRAVAIRNRQWFGSHPTGSERRPLQEIAVAAAAVGGLNRRGKGWAANAGP